MSFFYLLLTGILYSPLSADSMETHLCHIIFLSFYAQEINWHKLIKGLTKKKKKKKKISLSNRATFGQSLF